MLPHKHAVISAVLGTVGWWQTGKPSAFVAALTVGIFPDLDHVVDYLYYRQHKAHRLILPLHAYEYAFLAAALALVTHNKTLSVATLSYLVHLLADQAANKTHLLGYSLVFRARHRFRIEDISTVPEAAAKSREGNMRLLKNLFHHRSYSEMMKPQSKES